MRTVLAHPLLSLAVVAALVTGWLLLRPTGAPAPAPQTVATHFQPAGGEPRAVLVTP
ncbi:MAG: hypothetical protein HKN04_09930, partial [Rhodothermaceae bacterium]|nr:hypothetical protein [Rhodothermaceae bacterium]